MEARSARPLRSGSGVDAQASPNKPVSGASSRFGWQSMFARQRTLAPTHPSNEAVEAELALLYTGALEKLAAGQAQEAKAALLKVKRRIDAELDPESQAYKELLLAVLKNIGRAAEALDDPELAANSWIEALDFVDDEEDEERDSEESNDDVCVWLGILRSAKVTHRDALARMAADRLAELRPSLPLSLMQSSMTHSQLSAPPLLPCKPMPLTKHVKSTWTSVINAIVSSLNDDFLSIVVSSPSTESSSQPQLSTIQAPGSPGGAGAAADMSSRPSSPQSQSQPLPSVSPAVAAGGGGGTASSTSAEEPGKRIRRVVSSKPVTTLAVDELLLPLANLAEVEAAKERFEARLAQLGGKVSLATSTVLGNDSSEAAVRAFCASANGMPLRPTEWLARLFTVSASIPDFALAKGLVSAKPLLQDTALWIFELAEAASNTSNLNSDFDAGRARRLLSYALFMNPSASRPDLKVSTLRTVAEQARIAGHVRLAEAALDGLEAHGNMALWVASQRALIGLGVQAKTSLESDGPMTLELLHSLFSGFEADFDSLKRSPELLELALTKCKGKSPDLEAEFASMCMAILYKALPFASVLHAGVEAFSPVAHYCPSVKLIELATLIVASPASNAADVAFVRGWFSSPEWLDEAVCWVCTSGEAKETKLKSLLGDSYVATPLRLSYPLLIARNIKVSSLKSLLMLSWLAGLGDANDFSSVNMSEQDWFVLILQVFASSGASESISAFKLEMFLQPRLHKVLRDAGLTERLEEAEDDLVATIRGKFPHDKYHGLVFQWLAPYLWADVDHGPTRSEQAQWLEKLLKVDPQLPDGWYLLTNLKVQRAWDGPTTIKQLERDLEVNPDRLDTLKSLGLAHWNEPDSMAKSVHYWQLLEEKLRNRNSPSLHELRAGSIVMLRGEEAVVARIDSATSTVDVVSETQLERFLPMNAIEPIPNSLQHLSPDGVDSFILDCTEYCVASKLRVGIDVFLSLQFGLEVASNAGDSRAWEFACLLGDLPGARALAQALDPSDRGREFAIAHVCFLEGNLREALSLCPNHIRAAIALQRQDCTSDCLVPIIKNFYAVTLPSQDWLILHDQDQMRAPNLCRDAVEARALALRLRGGGEACLDSLLELLSTVARQRQGKSVSEEERIVLRVAAQHSTLIENLEAVYKVWIATCEARLALDDEVKVMVDTCMVSLYRRVVPESASETTDLDKVVHACEMNFPHLASRSQKGRSKLKLRGSKSGGQETTI